MVKHLRFVSAWLVATVLIWLGFVRRAKEATFRGEHILSIYFHKPSLNEFNACVNWLKKNKFSFLSTDDLFQIIDNNLPLPKGAVILTVDDGWQSNKTNIVDVAEKHQIPVTIFVTTEPVEKGVYWWSIIEEAQRRGMKTMKVEQLKKEQNQKRIYIVDKLRNQLKLKREALTVQQVKQIASSPWITVGAHTTTHPILSNCKEEQVYSEAHESRVKLSKWTGQNIEYFAYPNGDYSDREVRIISELGFKLAFSVRTEYLSKKNLKRRFDLPRFEVIENAPFAETICRLTGVWEPFISKVRSLFRSKPSFRKPIKLAKSKGQAVVSA